MKWAIIIPTWRRSELLRATLDSLSQQTFQDFEVIVVCDGQDAPTRAMSESYVASFPLSWIFHAVNSGWAAARNTGAYSSNSEMILFLDDDVIPSSELLRVHADKHAAMPNWPKSIVFGRTIEERQIPIVSETDRFLQQAWERFLAKNQPCEHVPDTVSVGSQAEAMVWCGLNCSMRRDLFVDMGGFDSVLRSDEEMELGLRLYRHGVQFHYATEAFVRHQDTKIMSDYFPRCWRQSGGFDVYRARELGQHSAQNSQLATMHHGPFLKRMLARFARHTPEICSRAAMVAEKVTDMTGARLGFGAWMRLRKASEYWSGVRETGITENELCKLVEPARRVLLFHSISTPQNLKEATYYTSPPKLRRFLGSMKRFGYRSADPRDWFTSHAQEREVLLTFDDGYDDVYSEILPLCLEFGLKPLVFIVAGQIGRSNYWDEAQGLRRRSLLTLAQMREMQKHGFYFGAHSMTHQNLTTLSNAHLRREVSHSKSRIEDLLGTQVDWFAYPYGNVDRRVRAAVAEAGFKAAFTVVPGLNYWEDPLALKRTEINNYDTQLDFIFKLQTGDDIRKNILRRGRKFIAKRWISAGALNGVPDSRIRPGIYGDTSRN